MLEVHHVGDTGKYVTRENGLSLRKIHPAVYKYLREPSMSEGELIGLLLEKFKPTLEEYRRTNAENS